MSSLPPGTSTAWPAVEQTSRIISAGQGSLNTLNELIRAVAAVGFGSLVEPILAAVNIPGPAWETQRAAVLARARQLAGSKVGWESLGQVFKNNLAMLTPGNSSLAGLEDCWRVHKTRFELHRAGDGNFQIVDKNAPSLFAGFLGGLRDHRALADQWTYRRNGLSVVRPISFDGAGYGWLLNRVLETTHESFLKYSCAIYVLEPDPAMICILLHLHDLTRWGPRLRFFVGDDPVGQMCNALTERPHWMLPAALISNRLAARSPLDIQSTLTAVAEERRQREESLLDEARRHYEPLTPAYWSARYDDALSGGKPLKVMGVTSRFTTVLQYSMDELGAAVRAAGHEFILAKEVDDQSSDRPEVELIAKHQPDLLVMISRMRYENPQLPKNMPFLCWDQDNLPCMRTPQVKQSLDALTFVAGVGALAGYQNFGWPRRNCIFVLQAASTHRYSNTPVDGALMEKHRCAFSYTSNCAATPESLAVELGLAYSTNSRVFAVFKQTAKELIARARTGFVWDEIPLMNLLDEVARADGLPLAAPLRREIMLNLRSISDRAFRHVALDWIAQYCRRKNVKLRLYGKGWESNPQFGEFAAGFLAPGEEMKAVYQATDINLQIIETGFQHSRALDGVAAGGFFLYRSGAETREFDQTAQDLLNMSLRATVTGCVTFGELDASHDPLIAPGWAHARTTIPLGKPEEVCPLIDRIYPAGIDDKPFPYLDEFSFSSQEQFNTMADRYLGDPELRRSVAGKIRRFVVERFSYDARWREFVKGISDGLRSAAAKPADIPLRSAA